MSKMLKPSYLGASFALGIALATSVGFIAQALLLPRRSSSRTSHLPSPRETLLPHLSQQEIDALPYPPDIMPGGRDVETPYGTMRVFEWGPEQGQKVLLLHGLSTPCLVLQDVAEALVARGYRVMLFDFFGRGFSDAVTSTSTSTNICPPYDDRLYTTQILLALATSQLPWTGDAAFHLLGYSLGGGVAVPFARYFPRLVRSLTLVAPGGLIRKTRASMRSRVLYSHAVARLVPDLVVRCLVRWRLTPKTTVAATRVVIHAPADIETQSNDPKIETDSNWARKNADTTGGTSFDEAPLSRHRAGSPTPTTMLAWQLQHHVGFVPAFLSSMRHAPIYERWDDWYALGRLLALRRPALSAAIATVDDENTKDREGGGKEEEEEEEEEPLPPGLMKGKVLLVLGVHDTVVVKEELVADACETLGGLGFDVVPVECGHEVPFTHADEVAGEFQRFWG